jgi:cation-transporting ATPase 13A1
LTQSGSTVSAEDALNAHDKVLQQRNQEYQAKHAAHMKAFQAQLQQQLADEMKAKMSEFIARGEYSAMFSAVKQNAIRTKDIIAQEQARFAALHGQTWDKKNGSSDPMASLMDSLETMDTGTLPMVRPGDASIAAPFTSRVPSVRAVVDLIRQGRCTLLSALMQQQIMMLESIISAYTLSALSLHNARSSERQMMASSWLIMTAAVSFSYAAPLDKMAKLRPLRSLFHPAILLSILGQAAIHVACMTLAVQWATEAMGPEQLKEVTEVFQNLS